MGLKPIVIEVCEEPEIQYAATPELFAEIREWLEKRGAARKSNTAEEPSIENAIYYDTKNNRLVREGMEYRVKQKNGILRHDMKTPLNTHNREVVPDNNGILWRYELKLTTSEAPSLARFFNQSLLLPVQKRVERFFGKELMAKFKSSFKKEKFNCVRGYGAVLIPKNAGDMDALQKSVRAVAEGNGSFSFETERDTGIVKLTGGNKEHVKELVAAIKNGFDALTVPGSAEYKIGAELDRTDNYSKIEYSFQTGCMETMDGSRRTPTLYILELELREEGPQAALLEEKRALEEAFCPKGLTLLKERKILMGFGLLEADMNAKQRQNLQDVRQRNHHAAVSDQPLPAQHEMAVP